MKRISDLFSEGITPEEAELIFNTELDYGDDSPVIRVLNYVLNFIAFFDQDLPFLDLSGSVFTKKTEEAVKAFQSKYNIEATGIVDANTWKALVEAYNQTLQKIPEEYLKYQSEFYPGIVLSKGMSGPDIVRLQNYLLLICQKTHSIPGVKVTGVFDDLTEQSVKAIQRRSNLFPGGLVDAATWYRIVELSKVNA